MVPHHKVISFENMLRDVHHLYLEFEHNADTNYTKISNSLAG